MFSCFDDSGFGNSGLTALGTGGGSWSIYTYTGYFSSASEDQGRNEKVKKCVNFLYDEAYDWYIGIYSWKDVPHFFATLLMGKFATALIQGGKRISKMAEIGCRGIATYLSATVSALSDPQSYELEANDEFLVDAVVESTNGWIDLLHPALQEPAKLLICLFMKIT